VQQPLSAFYVSDSNVARRLMLDGGYLLQEMIPGRHGNGLAAGAFPSLTAARHPRSQSSSMMQMIS
jgi:hypothetical protein